MKKVVLYLSLFAILLSLCACGAEEAPAATTEPTETTAPEATETRVLKLNQMLEENNPIAVGTQETSPGWYTAFELLDQEFELYKDTALSLCMLNLDDFKLYNQLYQIELHYTYL